MNCLEKMYKEIEEILIKEKLEQSRVGVFTKEIKYGFDSDDVVTVEPAIDVDYISQISLDGLKIDKKYFDEAKAKSFIEFIFKKYFCLYGDKNLESDFILKVNSILSESSDLVKALTSLENELVKLVGESEELTAFLLSPYSALYKDENGYYAVIVNGRYSDVNRPVAFNSNQLKKLVKESVDVYFEDFASKFNSDKEKNTFVNKIKADLNKSQTSECSELEKEMESLVYSALQGKGVTEEAFENYLENKGYRLIKQGNLFRKKAYQRYADYKKIEFRYWLTEYTRNTKE